MKTNIPATNPARTHEGTPAIPREDPALELRRAVLSCRLLEDSFYESGAALADRIERLAHAVSPASVAALAVEARQRHGLRHISLFLALTLVGRGVRGAAEAVASVIERPDELSEIVALYWRGGRKRLAPSLKRGLARAFRKFDAHRLAKYDRDTKVKLRDVMFLVHPKPADDEQAAAFKALASRTLAAPDTWEIALSSGADKRATWDRLLGESKLGALALLRNLRNMVEAKVPEASIRSALQSARTERVLPFRFIAAARHAPTFEPELEALMFRCVAGAPRLRGVTALVVDTSPSMWGAKVSERSEMDRFEAAAALAMLARETCEIAKVYRVAPRRGFALRDALAATKGNASCGGLAVTMANEDGYDRLVVVTDGQWHTMDRSEVYGYRSGDSVVMSPAPLTKLAYMVNVATVKPLPMVKYKWLFVSGWSDRLLDWIVASESSIG